MAEYIKIKHIIILSTAMLLLFAMLSSIAVGNSNENVCQEMRRDIKLCDFLAPAVLQKKICFENTIKKYGKDTAVKCRVLKSNAEFN